MDKWCDWKTLLHPKVSVDVLKVDIYIVNHKQGSHMALCRALFGSSWWFMSWLVVISSDSCHGLWWFMSWFIVVHVMVCGDLW